MSSKASSPTKSRKRKSINSSVPKAKGDVSSNAPLSATSVEDFVQKSNEEQGQTESPPPSSSTPPVPKTTDDPPSASPGDRSFAGEAEGGSSASSSSRRRRRAKKRSTSYPGVTKSNGELMVELEERPSSGPTRDQASDFARIWAASLAKAHVFLLTPNREEAHSLRPAAADEEEREDVGKPESEDAGGWNWIIWDSGPVASGEAEGLARTTAHFDTPDHAIADFILQFRKGIGDGIVLQDDFLLRVIPFLSVDMGFLFTTQMQLAPVFLQPKYLIVVGRGGGEGKRADLPHRRKLAVFQYGFVTDDVVEGIVGTTPDDKRAGWLARVEVFIGEGRRSSPAASGSSSVSGAGRTPAGFSKVRYTMYGDGSIEHWGDKNCEAVLKEDVRNELADGLYPL